MGVDVSIRGDGKGERKSEVSFVNLYCQLLIFLCERFISFIMTIIPTL